MQCLLYHIIINKFPTNMYSSCFITIQWIRDWLNDMSVHYNTDRWGKKQWPCFWVCTKMCPVFTISIHYIFTSSLLCHGEENYIYISSAIASNNIRDHANSYTKFVNFSPTVQKCWNYSKNYLDEITQKRDGLQAGCSRFKA